MYDKQLFFLVLARDGHLIEEKTRELEQLGVPYRIVCGEKMQNEAVVYQPPEGKYNAINFGARFISRITDVVALNDVDTKIYGLNHMLRYFEDEDVALVFAKPYVQEGPQTVFYMIMNALRSRLPIASSGELMLIKRKVLDEVLPLKPCKAEDSYILFKVLERGYKVVFCQDCIAETARTKSAKGEEEYKRINVAGIYQALSFTKPPALIRLFYVLLPVLSPLLIVVGEKGYYWSRGIIRGFLDYVRGDRSGVWQPTYMQM